MIDQPHVAAAEKPDSPTVPVWQLTVPVAADAAWWNWTGFVQLLPREQSRKPPAFIPTAGMPNLEWFAHLHTITGEVPPLGCHFLSDAIITGEGYVFAGDRLVTQDVYLHKVAVVELERRPELRPGAVPRCEPVVAGRPVIEILGPGSPVYGHWLVDFLPRAAIARDTLGEAFHDFLIPLPVDLPGWAMTLLTRFIGFRPENALRYDAATQQIVCPKLCIPTFAHSAGHYCFHSYVRDFYGRFLPRRVPSRRRRLCLSRRNFEQETRGVLKGFEQRVFMEAAAERLGFEIVCPETLGIEEQIEMFHDAGIVLGEYGSALHNTLFSAPRTIIGSIRYPNSVQTQIAGVMGQHVLYLIPERDERDSRGAEIYATSEPQVEAFLEQLVRLHEGSLLPPISLPGAVP